MSLEAALSGIRYGYGLTPNQTTASGADALVASLNGRDAAAVQFPVAPMPTRLKLLAARRASRKDGSQSDREKADRDLRAQAVADMRSIMQRMIGSDAGLRERLVAFWSDHFTVAANGPVLSLLVADFIETVVRPNIAGHFPKMLQAACQHPAMLMYLNQHESIGPNSAAGKRRDRGLNENLAREVLELHTLGVGGNYGQNDVRELAKLLTGLGVSKEGFVFRRRVAEPGAETVLGTSYGGDPAALDHILAALRDIALHPDTAGHLSAKLIVHFIGISPPEDLVTKMSRAYVNADGDLTALYRVMLNDARAWSLPLNKVKPPIDFMVSALRAAAVTAKDIGALDARRFRRTLSTSLTEMGQVPFRPKGPDGWPEEPDAWITPATLAARLRWVAGLVDENLVDTDPREFLETTLGAASSDLLRRAVGGAESKGEGAAIVLASPDFNRR